ncbi:conserved membrane hypothetical protein [Verrucomicrobia bacterium]|nr:conserved membrane hypothetical protein [Verrucomicrobiota bacterium]
MAGSRQIASDMKKAELDSTCAATQCKRTWGCRFSATDAVALSAFGAAGAVLYLPGSSLWWVVAIAAGHFFLFCNVFRLVRRRELIWAAVFVLNVTFWILLGRLDCSNVMACQLPVSTGVIAWEIKATRYHGIFADRLNPKLGDYIEGRIP